MTSARQTTNRSPPNSARASTTGNSPKPPRKPGAETHLHARNLLGEHGYSRLLAELKKGSAEQPPSTTAQPLSEVAEEGHRWDDWLSAPGPSDE